MKDMLAVVDNADFKGKCTIDCRPKGTGSVELAYGPKEASKFQIICIACFIFMTFRITIMDKSTWPSLP